MKMLKYILIYICSTVFLFSLQSCNKSKNELSKEYAFVFSKGIIKDDENIYLLGEFKKGLQVSLLQIDKPIICSAITEEVIHYVSTVTKLKTGPECVSPGKYSLAIVGEGIIKYEIVGTVPVEKKTDIVALGVIGTSSDAIQKIKANGSPILNVPDHITSELPRVETYPVPGKTVHIVQYNAKYNGPRVVIIDDKPFPLSGWCSLPYMRTFTINQEYFIESGSFGCSNGLVSKELSKITDKGLEFVYVDINESM